MNILKPLSLAVAASLALSHSAPAESDGAYRLKPNDQIKLSVYRESDLDSEVHLTNSGEASFPLVNAVQLLGLTLKEAEEKLARLYDADYLVDPKLSLNLMQAAPEHVGVIGAVAAPKDVPLPRAAQLDLLAAIASAGGLTDVADRERIELTRGETRHIYSMAKLEARGAKPVIVEPGDRINIATSRFAGQTVMVVGEVGKSGPVPFPISGRLDLATLLEAAGGVGEKGDSTRIRITRGEKRYVANLNEIGRHPVAPGDVVSVPPNAFVGKTVTIMGKVNRPGPVKFPFDGKLTALQAVASAGGFSDLANRKKVYLTRNGKRQVLNLKDVAEGKSRHVVLTPGDTLFVDVRVF